MQSYDRNFWRILEAINVYDKDKLNILSDCLIDNNDELGAEYLKEYIITKKKSIFWYFVAGEYNLKPSWRVVEQTDINRIIDSNSIKVYTKAMNRTSKGLLGIYDFKYVFDTYYNALLFYILNSVPREKC